MAGTPLKRARREAGIILVGDKPPQGYDFSPRITQIAAGQTLSETEVARARSMSESIIAAIITDHPGELTSAVMRGMANPDDNAALNGAKLALGVIDRAKQLKVDMPKDVEDAHVLAAEYVDTE